MATIAAMSNDSGIAPGSYLGGTDNWSNGRAHGGSAGAPNLRVTLPTPYGSYEYPSLRGSQGGRSSYRTGANLIR